MRTIAPAPLPTDPRDAVRRLSAAAVIAQYIQDLTAGAQSDPSELN